MKWLLLSFLKLVEEIDMLKSLMAVKVNEVEQSNATILLVSL